MQIFYDFYLNNTGYSISGQEYILSMLSVDPNIDIKVNFMNMETGIGVSQKRLQIFKSLQSKKQKDSRVNVFHSVPHRYKHIGGCKNIGVCVYETIDPPKDWIHMMNNMNGIITASSFNKNIFESGGLNRPVTVIPHCFDPEMFHKDVKPLGRYDMFTFMSMGTWKRRKNWEVLIKSWYAAFEKKDNACLIIKTDKAKECESLIIKIKKTGEWRDKPTCPIFLEDKSLCQFEDIPQIMKKADVYINASLGEGYGIPGMHAMALDIPLVTTRFGGCLEYAHPEYCTYIEPSGYTSIPSMDGIPQLANKIWPIITINNLSSVMKYCLFNQEDIKRKSKVAYEYMHKKCSYKSIGNLLISSLLK